MVDIGGEEQFRRRHVDITLLGFEAGNRRLNDESVLGSPHLHCRPPHGLALGLQPIMDSVAERTTALSKDRVRPFRNPTLYRLDLGKDAVDGLKSDPHLCSPSSS
jgi:hypothetical protein